MGIIKYLEIREQNAACFPHFIKCLAFREHFKWFCRALPICWLGTYRWNENKEILRSVHFLDKYKTC